MIFNNTHHQPSLAARLWLLAALFSVTIPHLLYLPLSLSLLCALVFGWRLLHELKGVPHPPRWLKFIITLLSFALVLSLFKTVMGRDAGVALLCVMVALKLFELKSVHDCLLTLYLGYFLVISAFLFEQSILIGGYLLLQVIFLTSALLAINHPKASFAHGRVFIRYAGMMMLQSLPIMVLLFFLFPRLNTPLWSMPQGSFAKTGLSDHITMGSISSLVTSEEVAFRVEFDSDIPDPAQLYWRGPVLWQTDGRSWQRLNHHSSTTLPQFENLGSDFSYRVALEPNGYHWLFTLDLPSALPQGVTESVFVTPDFQLLTKRPLIQKLNYRSHSSLSYRLLAIDKSSRRAALQLPVETNPKTLLLAQNWRNTTTDDLVIVERALSYFRDNSFYYTRTPPLLGNDPVDDFLFNTRRGFCEHYATSFVTLMRAAGIPARVVTGYQGGERNPIGNYLIVRQSSAHAWAEVWLEGQGWIRVDPTTAVPRSNIDSVVDMQRFSSTDILSSVTSGDQFGLLRKWLFQFRQLMDGINYGWNMWVLGFDREQQEKLLKQLGFSSINTTTLLVSLVGLIFLLLAALSIFVLRQQRRQSDPIQRAYLSFCKKLAALGVPMKIGEGPRDYSLRACRARPEKCEQISSIIELYITLRYAQCAGENELLRYREEIRKFK